MKRSSQVLLSALFVTAVSAYHADGQDIAGRDHREDSTSDTHHHHHSHFHLFGHHHHVGHSGHSHSNAPHSPRSTTRTHGFGLRASAHGHS